MIKYCKKCFKEGRKNCPTGYSYGWKDEVRYCPQDNCGGEMIDIDFPSKDLSTLLKISPDVDFIESMISLKEKDNIDYNLKMSQFRNQVEQQKQTKSVEENKPRCPICQSTSLSKITSTKKVAKIVAFGIFGMGDNGKTWRCNNCGSKF